MLFDGSFAPAMSHFTDLEEPETVLATQELLVYESVDISECLGDKFDKSACFQKPGTVNEIEQREKDNFKSTKYPVVGKRLSSLG